MSEAQGAAPAPQGRQTDLPRFFKEMRACQDEPAVHHFVSGAFRLTWERRKIDDEETDEFTLYKGCFSGIGSVCMCSNNAGAIAWCSLLTAIRSRELAPTHALSMD